MSLADISNRVSLLADAVKRLDAVNASADALAADQKEWRGDVDNSWTVATFILVFAMVAGMTLREAGSCRRNNAAGHIVKNLSATAVATLTFWFCGWALSFGVNNNESVNGFIGNSDLLLVTDRTFSGEQYAYYSFQLALLLVSLHIVLGAATERMTFLATNVFSFFFSAFVYPIVAHWIWSESGWVSSKNTTTNFLGKNGALDFAGVIVVHLVGGVAAFAVTMIAGPRNGRFTSNNAADYTEGNSSLYKFVGTVLLWIGSYGLTLGASNAVTMNKSALVAKAAINVTLSGAAAALVALLASRGNLSRAASGALAGLVAISGACAFVEPWAAALIGAVAGVAYLIGMNITEAAQCDDATSAYAVHASAAIWGALATGVFATEKNTMMAIGRDTSSYGFLYGGGASQFGIQLLTIIVVFLWTFIWSAVIAFVLKAVHRLTVDDATQELSVDLSARSEAYVAAYLGLSASSEEEQQEAQPVSSPEAAQASA